MRENLKLLVVDDDPCDRFIIEQSLREEADGSWNVVSVGCLRDAIKAALSQDFDVVLVDLILPESRGLETVRMFRAEVPDVPIVVLSGMHDEQLALAALEEGAQDYIEKESIESRSIGRSIRHSIQRHELQTRIKDLAFTDPVTSLPNRVRFARILDEEFTRSVREGKTDLCVMFVDLDEFKLVNDTYGHEKGDLLLAEFAERVNRVKRRDDTVARFGGDEFVILVKDAADDQVVDAFVERLRKSVESPFEIGEANYHISGSIGIVRMNDKHSCGGDMLRDADTAMYRAKEEGKSTTQWFNSSMRDRAVERLALESRMRMALEREQFELFYQPIIDLRTRDVTRFEALLRWRHPTDGLIPPIKFIPLLETTGLIVPVGDWVLHEACRQLAVWRSRYENCDSLSISVNVSPIQLLSGDFVERVKHAVEEHDLAHPCLDLEVTESTIMRNKVRSHEVLRELRDFGVRIEIDDFGTGYSSLSQLYQFEYDVLKIDQSFIASMLDEGDTFVRAILMLGDFLNIEVVAEGIEVEEQAKKLYELGCTVGQGYLFDKPLEAFEASRYFVRAGQAEPIDCYSIPEDA